MTVVQSALAPFTMKGFYLLTWGTAIGSNVWSTIVSTRRRERNHESQPFLSLLTIGIFCRYQSGYRTYQSLPRTTFGTLQGRLTPLYFSFQTLSTATLLLTHLWFHPALISSPLVEPHWATCEEGRQGLLILASVVPSLLNWVLVGPMATDVMLERHRLERLESKEYDEPNVRSFSDIWTDKRECLLTFRSALSRPRPCPRLTPSSRLFMGSPRVSIPSRL